ncbi:hypothetical protein [Cryobacterium sp. Y50]|uniref:hypothetical protein n=1 Tax=Cryobacterium sp. Y50 TaxID=2048286 RepID=UPI000CE52B0B|nr:hypothetical protein [Cryobacterium sp. Y50]
MVQIIEALVGNTVASGGFAGLTERVVLATVPSGSDDAVASTLQVKLGQTAVKEAAGGWFSCGPPAG